MYYTVTDARHVKDYTIWLRFADGTEGDVDLADELWGPVFEPLKNPEFFSQFEVAEYGTLAWPNGADLAPEFLYSRVRATAKT